MKIFVILVILLQFTTPSNMDDEKDYDLVDEEEDEPEVEEDEHVEPPHLIPDINCMINDFPELFGFPEKELNAKIKP